MLRRWSLGSLVLLSAVSCKKKEEKKEAAPDVQPGEVLGVLDSAMGSIAFEGQAALISSWSETHCEESGDGTKDAYSEEEDVVWVANYQQKLTVPTHRVAG